jgi:hypothetical protein
MSRVVLALVLVACAGEQKTGGGGAAPPPGPGYGVTETPQDMRLLSRDDCIALRDHQIEIAVSAAVGDEKDQGKKLEVEARVRADHKTKSEEWVKSCSGRSVPAKLVRCWKDSTTPAAMIACDSPAADAGSD